MQRKQSARIFKRASATLWISLSLFAVTACSNSIDPRRIGLVGHSNGGFMALRMACEASDLVTAVVSLAGSTWKEDSSCAPATFPVNVLTLHGDNDDTIFL